MKAKPHINSPKLWGAKFPELKPSDNKYTRGHLLINGAPLECTGATRLAAYAAARSGAGMVTVACDRESLPVYQNSFLSIMAKPIKAPNDFYRFIESKKVNTVLIGPGNGTHLDTAEKVLECLENKKLKMVIDADAISVFEDNKRALIDALHANCILTPHEGEFKRLFALSTNRQASAVAAAKKCGAVVVLKGHDTIIASPAGKVVVNINAPATLATAGTGDVLAGIISGLFVQGMPAFEAACAGVYIHAECADALGRGLMADDLMEVIPEIIQSL
jgi:hydroxyethylthiazole kinase-like uncharacterized protein yjeF